MKWRVALSLVLCFLAVKSFGQSATHEADNAPTYSKDVAPILQKKCQVCHRAGEAGPFPLMTYEQARPWAMAMKIAVQARKMPPWFADPQYGRFSNANGLEPAEIELLSKWADAGAPKGDAKDLPLPV